MSDAGQAVKLGAVNATEDSKFMKYGSSSCSLKCCDSGGKRPKICSPGIVWAAVDGLAAYSVGWFGMPWGFVVEFEAALSFAEEAGIGSQACAGVGLAVYGEYSLLSILVGFYS